MSDPIEELTFTRWLASRPDDDEPLTPAERAALAESAADIAAGRTVSFEEIKREFGCPAFARYLQAAASATGCNERERRDLNPRPLA